MLFEKLGEFLFNLLVTLSIDNLPIYQAKWVGSQRHLYSTKNNQLVHELIKAWAVYLFYAGMIKSRDSQRVWNETSPYQYCLSHFERIGNIVLTVNKREIMGVKRE